MTRQAMYEQAGGGEEVMLATGVPVRAMARLGGGRPVWAGDGLSGTGGGGAAAGAGCCWQQPGAVGAGAQNNNINSLIIIIINNSKK